MKTILVIDDQPNIRTLLKFDTKDKFHVVTVHNNMEALQWLRADHKPDLIVFYGTMPYLDGFEFLKIIRASDKHRDVPVIMLSAKATSEDRICGLRAGADDYVTKPFNLEELFVRIETVFNRLATTPTD